MAIMQRSELNQPDSLLQRELHQKNSIWFCSFEICSIRWWQRKFDSNRVESNGADAASKWNGRRKSGTTAFIPSPPLAPRAMKNIACELRGVQRGICPCLLGTTVGPLSDNTAKLKACCRLPVLQPEPLPLLPGGKPTAQRRGLMLHYQAVALRISAAG